MSRIRSSRVYLPALAACLSLAVLTAPASSAIRGARDRGTALEPNVVQGTVRTEAGRPIAGATIRIAGATGAGRGTTIKATTDRNGNYRVRVPLGHYDVEGFADIEYAGHTYTGLSLEPVNARCERVMSDKGIVRDFVLRLSGLRRCGFTPNPNQPAAYRGGFITAMTGAFPADAVITFRLAPVGPLADGSTGRPITFTRTGAALARGGGKTLDETAFLHDIPLGRYRVTAEVRYANGVRRALALDWHDDDAPEATAVDVLFPPARLGGFASVNLGVRVGGREPSREPGERPVAPVTPAAPGPSVPVASAVPEGRYACSYRSQYAGEIPTGNAITLNPDGTYEAYSGSGGYSVDARAESIRWTSGPLAGSGTRATFARPNGRPTITVVGGPASGDPGRTNQCVLSGR